MKILIGTPIHQVKDYSMERWLKNVSELNYPTHLFMVDNSQDEAYLEKVKAYCAKYGLKNYKITHINLPPEQKIFERVARAREIIRREVLAGDYDAWFSWECDQLIPNNALDQLVNMMQAGNFMMVNHNGWDRVLPEIKITDFGVSLIRRDCLEKHGFLLDFGTDPDMPDTWEPGEAWYKQRVLRDGGNMVEVDGVIKPIYHLNN